MTDELSAPLGQDRRKRRLADLPKVAAAIFAALLGAGLLALVAYVALVDDPLGGEPVVVVALDKPAQPSGEARAAKDAGPSAAAPGTSDAASAAVPSDKPNGPTVTIIDGLSGKRQQVTFAPGQESAKVIAVEPAAGGKEAAASATPQSRSEIKPSANAPGVTVRPGPTADRIPGRAETGKMADRAAAAGNPALLETTRFGALPKVAADGARPLEAYAAAPDPAVLRGNAPRIAIVLTRLGLSAGATAEALGKLPAAITLGLVPYAADLDRLIGRARGEGRELLLQIPMEPFDFPDNDPGPQALMVGLPVEQNVDRLQGFLGRAQGYVGIAPFMGGRYVGQETAIGPVLREAGKRGLMYFDDGSAARAVTAQVAAAQGVPFARADVVLDTTPTKAEVDAALRRLEALARDRGHAIGVAGASPVSIDRLAQWSKGLAARGFALVPLTALVNKPKSS